MTTVYLGILLIIIVHWFADFVLQTNSQAKGKSKNWKPLLQHTLNYSLCWMIVGIIIYPSWSMFIGFTLPFTVITLVAHTITDYFTSRLNRKLWEQGRTHAFFVSVGFDQVLHYAQLFGTYFGLIYLWKI